MDWNHYRFRHVWRLPAPPDQVYAVLERLADYPDWWPEVRGIRQVDDYAAELVIRSVLPYDLVFVARHARADPDLGVLEADLSGDVIGRACWTLTSTAGGTRAEYVQQVEVGKPLLRRLRYVARPVFRANHWLMMRHGYRELRRVLRSG